MRTVRNHVLNRFPNACAIATGAVLAAALASPAADPGTDLVERAPRTASRSDDEIPFAEARIYWEYNASANDLGVHVFLDGEDWKRLKIENPRERVLFEVKGKGPYRALGMTELFFEGAEPSLAQFPLERLLALFPEGEYTFEGRTVDGEELESTYELSHAIPAGPVVRATVGAGNHVEIGWDEVTSPPPGFPNRPIEIAGYQVIVGSFQVTLPATARKVTVPPEYVASLAPGEQPYEVLAIEKNANQTLTEGVFVK